MCEKINSYNHYYFTPNCDICQYEVQKNPIIFVNKLQLVNRYFNYNHSILIFNAKKYIIKLD